MTILVVTGVAREARIAAGPGVETVCSGGAPARLRALLAAPPAPAISAILSFGIAGGLDPALGPGHVVAADAVVAEGGRWGTDLAITNALMRALPAVEDLKVLRASVLGVDVALLDSSAKSMARRNTGAAAVDMESHIAAGYADRHGLPFAAIRVVCDPAGDTLPPLVNDALKADGSVSLRGVFGSLKRQPGQIGGLIRLARSSQIAFRALTQVGTTLQAAFPRG